MIRNITTLDGFDVREWQNNIQSDEDDKTWIWNQLMGETAKGDTLEFRIIKRGDQGLFAGVLRDKNGQMKALVPARFYRYHGEDLYEIDWKGKIHHDKPDVLGYQQEVTESEIGIEEAARQFLQC